MAWKPEDLESVICNYCGGLDQRVVMARSDGFNAVECTNCGLCYINTRPRAELMESQYEPEYFRKTEITADQSGSGFEDYYNKINKFALRDLAELRLDMIRKYFNLAGKVCLEVGCASGEFCNTLKKRSADVMEWICPRMQSTKPVPAFAELISGKERKTPWGRMFFLMRFSLLR